MSTGIVNMSCTESIRTIPSSLTQAPVLDLPGGLRMFRPMIQNISDFAYSFDSDGILRNTHTGETLSMKVTFTGASLRRQEMIRAMCIREVRQRLYDLNIQTSQIPIPGHPTASVRVLHSTNLFTHRGPVLLVLQGGAMSQAGVWATRLLLHPQHGLRSGSQIDLVRKAHELGYAVALIHGGDYGPSEAELDAIELMSVLSRPIPPTAPDSVVLADGKEPTATLSKSLASFEIGPRTTMNDPLTNTSPAIPTSGCFPVSMSPLDPLGFPSSQPGLISLRSASSSALFSLLLSNFNPPTDGASTSGTATFVTPSPPSFSGDSQPTSSSKTCKSENLNNSVLTRSTCPSTRSGDEPRPNPVLPRMGLTVQGSNLKHLEEFTRPTSDVKNPLQPDCLASAGLFRRNAFADTAAQAPPDSTFNLPVVNNTNERITDISIEDQLYGVWRQLVPRLLSDQLFIWAHQQGGVGLVYPLRPMPGVFDGFPEQRCTQSVPQGPSTSLDFSVPPSNTTKTTFNKCPQSIRHSMKSYSTTSADPPPAYSVNASQSSQFTSISSVTSSPLCASKCFPSQPPEIVSTSNCSPFPSISGKVYSTRKRHMSAGPLLSSSRTRFSDRAPNLLTSSQHSASQTGHICSPATVTLLAGNVPTAFTGSSCQNSKCSPLCRSPGVLNPTASTSFQCPASATPSNSVQIPVVGAADGSVSAIGGCSLDNSPQANSLKLRLAQAWQKKARRLVDELMTRVKGIVFTECPMVLNLEMDGIGWGTQLLVDDNAEKPSPTIFKPLGFCLPPRVLETRKWLSEHSVHYVASDAPLGTKLNGLSTADHQIPVLSSGTTEHDLIPSAVQDTAFAFFQEKRNAPKRYADNGAIDSSHSSDNIGHSSVSEDGGSRHQSTAHDSFSVIS